MEELNVDAAYCISLKDSHDRRKRLENEWTKIGVKVEYILCDKAENPALDCSQTHQEIARRSKAAGHSRVLVFEDDVRFYRIPTKHISRINTFMQKNQTWDIFYLGGILGKLWLTRYRGIARIRCAGVQSYILHQRSFERISGWDYTKDTRAVDTVYKKILKAYCCFPLITRQEDESLAPSGIAKQRLKEGSSTGVNSQSVWSKTRKRQYWYAYFRYLHRFIFGLKQ